MSFAHQLISVLNRVLGPIDTHIIRKSEFDRLKSRVEIVSALPDRNSLPAGAESYLRPDNPRLLELTERYDEIKNPALQRSRWTKEYVKNYIDLRYFRGNNAYVFNDRNVELSYVLTAYYLMKSDHKNLLDRLTEDGLFGAPIFEFEKGKYVSRDLLDSIAEMHFLDDNLGLSEHSNFEVLDIGAGYGRFSHRLVESYENVKKTFCVDVIPESTFCSEYYLNYRKIDDKAVVVPIDELETVLSQNNILLAVNIHSFSECPLKAIEWWIETLKRHNVRYLMIVPNAAEHGGTKLLSQEVDGQTLDFSAALEANGYRQIAQSPKFKDEVIQRLGISTTYHYLFELIS